MAPTIDPLPDVPMRAAQDAVRNSYIHGFWKGAVIAFIASTVLDLLIFLAWTVL